MNFNEMLDKIIDEAAVKVDNQMSEELAEPENEIVFEKENEIIKLFKNDHRRKTIKRYSKYLTRAACVLLVLLIGASVTIGSVEAWRVKFLNFVFEQNEPNSHFNYDDIGGTTYFNDYITLKYVPLGFKIDNDRSNDKTIFIKFVCENNYFNITRNEFDIRSNIDTEDAVSEEIKINGYKGIYISNDNISSVIWTDNEYGYRIAGDISKEELIKIAQNLEKIEKKQKNL